MWGQGKQGQLGLSHVQRLNVPTRVCQKLLGHERVAMVACGRSHTACVSETGKLWTWGLGEDGQLGHDSHASLSAPTLLESDLFGHREVLMVRFCPHRHVYMLVFFHTLHCTHVILAQGGNTCMRAYNLHPSFHPSIVARRLSLLMRTLMHTCR